MNIAGIGMVSARGRGVASLEQALTQGWMPPTDVAVRGIPSGQLPVYAVAPDVLSDKTVLAKARRADRFTKLCVLAASDAFQDGGGGRLDRSRVGLIVATALGPHATTFKFLDGILDFGDAAVSPTTFSHSVHNAAASYIAMTLDVRGPTLTVTHFRFAFHEALLLAREWLRSGRCEGVLVGVADELGSVLQYVCGRMLRPAADGRIKPFHFSATPEAVPGEGSAFLLLTGSGPSGYGRVVNVWRDRPPTGSGPAVHLLDACGLEKDEAGYLSVIAPGEVVAGYSPLWGSLLTGSAFHVAVAALMVKRQMRYAVPVPDNPHGVALCLRTEEAPVENVFCSGLDCGGGRMTVQVAGG